MPESLQLSIEIYQENGAHMCFIGTESGSGASYPVTDISDIGNVLAQYLKTYYPNCI